VVTLDSENILRRRAPEAASAKRTNLMKVRLDRGTLLTLALLALGVAIPGVWTSFAHAQPARPPELAKPKLGLLMNEPTAFKGYTLIAPNDSNTTYLIDMDGRVVQTWKSDCHAGESAYLLENGHLLRSGAIKNPPFFGAGAGGRIQEFTWDGELVWEFQYSNKTQYPHHDICRLPNGNVLMIVWEKKTSKEAVAAGRRPETAGSSHLLADSILEIKPIDEKSGKVVWEWHSWDHLIQDFDDKQANHGDVGAHPELIDLNFGEATIAAMIAKPEELEKLKAIGYVGGVGRKPPGLPGNDWLHVNAVAYNPELDQIMLSSHEFSEFWIIDHSTTMAEAAGHKGGKYGKGGDLLYRWGNPRAYRAGTIKDQKLFSQHNAHWIGKGLPGEGHVLVFNNGLRRTGGAYSTVDEIVLPVDDKGEYEYTKGKAFAPDKAVWSYAAPKKTDFYASIISGAQRLPNGDTLICSGTNGTVFEVTPKDEVVWKYVNPAKSDGGFGFGPPGGGRGGNPFVAAPKLGQLVSPIARGMLRLNDEQTKQLEAVEKEFGEKLGKMLTDEQKKQFEDPSAGIATLLAPGQLVAAAVVEKMKLTDEQKKLLADLQKEANDKLGTILRDDQKKQMKEMQDRAKAFGGFGGGGIPGFDSPGGGSALFRAPRYASEYAGLKGKDLKPGKTIEEIEANPPKNVPKETKDK
jgi:hypothetical protein